MSAALLVTQQAPAAPPAPLAALRIADELAQAVRALDQAAAPGREAPRPMLQPPRMSRPEPRATPPGGATTRRVVRISRH